MSRRMLLQLFAEDPNAGVEPSGDTDVQDAAGQDVPGDQVGPDAGDEGSESEVVQDQQQTRTYTDEDVQRIVSQRVKKLNRYKEAIERMAQATGMDPEQVVEQINQLIAMRAGFQQPTSFGNPPAQPGVLDPAEIARSAGQVALETHRKVEIYELSQNHIYKPILEDEEKRQELIDHANRRGITLREAFWQLYGEEMAQRLAREDRKSVV